MGTEGGAVSEEYGRVQQHILLTCSLGYEDMVRIYFVSLLVRYINVVFTAMDRMCNEGPHCRQISAWDHQGSWRRFVQHKHFTRQILSSHMPEYLFNEFLPYLL